MKTEGKKKSGLGGHPEARLYEQVQEGCGDSLDLLMARHEPLVLYAVNRQKLGDLPFEEAVQAGRIGLWGAIQGYDPDKGYQFSTYAYAAIVHQVWAAVKDHCVANGREHATREWADIFPTLGSGSGRNTSTGRSAGKSKCDGEAFAETIREGHGGLLRSSREKSRNRSGRSEPKWGSRSNGSAS